MDEEELICDYCEEAVDELFETEDGKQLCASCLEASDYVQCDRCERWLENLTETPAGETVCDECIQGSMTYDDFVGEYRFLIDTVNYETLHMDKSLDKELRDKLTSLIKQALIDGDKESKEAFDKFYPLKRRENDEYTDDLLDEFIDDCMSDENIVETLNAFDYNVQDATMSEGAHGHDTYGVIFVR